MSTETDLTESISKQLLEFQNKDLSWRKKKFFLMAAFIFICGALYVNAFINAFGNNPATTDDYAAMVKIDGPIMPNAKNSALNVITSLEKAFNDENAKGIVLLVNSPGGTPVQASLIAAHIKRLRAENPDKEIVTVAEDVIASGAYMLAMGTDEIYVHESTIAGSIGVVSEGFGFQGILDVVGVERRVHTAGSNKRRLDPYFPERAEDVEVLNERLEHIHQQFITLVKTSRGDKLKASDDILFTGDVWTGDEAVNLGLVDGISDLDSVIRDKFDVKYVKDVTEKPSVFDQLAGSFKKQVSILITEMSTGSIKAY